MKQYIRPEITDKEQLQVSEAIAACQITFTTKYQNFDQRKIPSGEFNYDEYGYLSEDLAYEVRAGSGDWGPVGKIYAVDYIDDEDVHHTFYWEDFNNNYVYDEDYSTTNRYGQSYAHITDNFQSVGGNLVDPNGLYGPISGLPIRS